MYCQQCKLDIKAPDQKECPLCSSALLPDPGSKISAPENSPPENQARQETFTSVNGPLPQNDGGGPEIPVHEGEPPVIMKSSPDLSASALPVENAAAAPGDSEDEGLPIDLSMPETLLELNAEPQAAASPEDPAPEPEEDALRFDPPGPEPEALTAPENSPEQPAADDFPIDLSMPEPGPAPKPDIEPQNTVVPDGAPAGADASKVEQTIRERLNHSDTRVVKVKR